LRGYAAALALGGMAETVAASKETVPPGRVHQRFGGFMTVVTRPGKQSQKTMVKITNFHREINYFYGKHTKNYGKSQFLMGKLTISTGPFSIANC